MPSCAKWSRSVVAKRSLAHRPTLNEEKMLHRALRRFRFAIQLCLVASLVLAGCSRRSADEESAVGANSKALTPGLVAAYGFEEGTGTTAADSSGNHLDGIVTGAVWRRGKFGNALRFKCGDNSSSNDWVTIPDSAALQLTTGMTLSAWVFPSVEQNPWPTVIMKEGQSELIYALYANSDTGVPGSWLLHAGEEESVRGQAALPIREWS